MPTTLPLALGKADARFERSVGLDIANKSDLAIAAAFTAIGLALTIGLIVWFPQAANAVALAMIGM